MEEHEISIKVATKYRRAKILKIPVPFKKVEISEGNYNFYDVESIGVESPCNPLECLIELLFNSELNRYDKQIGPIHATFELRGKARKHRLYMEKLLRMYAYAEHTTVTFEYK